MLGTNSGDLFHETEIQHFHEVVSKAYASQVNVRRFDVAVHQSEAVRFVERIAHLTQNVNHPSAWQRTLLAHQSLEVHSLEKLHHQVERAILGHAEIVELHGVR